jgi:hypothetical protein
LAVGSRIKRCLRPGLPRRIPWDGSVGCAQPRAEPVARASVGRHVEVDGRRGTYRLPTEPKASPVDPTVGAAVRRWTWWAARRSAALGARRGARRRPVRLRWSLCAALEASTVESRSPARWRVVQGSTRA